jgi:hypothetical protein
VIEEKIYVVDDGVELIIMARVNYYGIDYMLLKNSKNSEIRIAYEYNSKLFYINKDDENYEIITDLLFDQLKETLEQI